MNKSEFRHFVTELWSNIAMPHVIMQVALGRASTICRLCSLSSLQSLCWPRSLLHAVDHFWHVVSRSIILFRNGEINPLKMMFMLREHPKMSFSLAWKCWKIFTTETISVFYMFSGIRAQWTLIWCGLRTNWRKEKSIRMCKVNCFVSLLQESANVRYMKSLLQRAWKQTHPRTHIHK